MPLLVYKSSAGSGKTTTLVNEYLKITLNNPPVFRNVLAITFTNKAANEMKEKVLDALVKLSSGEWANFNELKSLVEELALGDKETELRASKLLSLIMHRYDEFAISTIDSFVHSIVRTFATDIKLPQNFEVVIDNDDIIPEIIEKLYEKVDNQNVFTGLMVDFVMKQVEDEKSYDITTILSEFINKQLNEESHYHLRKIEHLNVEDFLTIINKTYGHYLKNKKALKETGRAALHLIEGNGLSASSLAGGKNGVYNYFSKLEIFKDDKNLMPTATVVKNIEEDKWYGSKANQAEKNAIDSIKEELINKLDESKKLYSEYWLFKLISEKIHQLALMREIRYLFNEYTEQTQRVHISEFNKKINDQIAGQPIPFIYERLGRKYQHFLIDEFQDTSLLQWQNLLPLLEESLANNKLNMLVGDTKQAIYRFRGGEVELFASLPRIYKNDASPEMQSRERMLEMTFNEKFLEVNYRSKEEIIRFNNEFFTSVKQSVSPWLQDIYKKHSQQNPGTSSKKGGYVSVELIPAENVAEYHEKRLLQILQYIDRLLLAGNARKDICILSRSNANSSEIATFLVESGHKVISPESLLLTNSSGVRLIIAFLKLISDSNNKLFLAEFVYNLLLARHQKAEFHAVFSEITNSALLHLDGLFAHLQLEMESNEFVGLSIFETVELAIRKLQLNKDKDVFLLNFLDFVYEHQDVGMGRLDIFLEIWESKKSKASVITPEEEDAIRVMTIHKAKGLKFNNVIVDITEGRNIMSKSEFWTELNLAELEELKIGLLPMKKEIEIAGLEDIYVEEKNKTLLDFINIVYVSFTRAVNSLFIVSHLKEKKSNKLTEFLVSFLSEKGLWSKEKLTYDFGELLAAQAKEQEKKSKLSWDEFISTDWKSLLTVAGSEEVMWDLLDQKPARSFGNLLHIMLSQIITYHDVDRVVQSYLHSGIIDIHESEEIQKMLFEVVNHHGLKSLFDEDKIVKNECSIIDKNGEVLRPDRVVVDGDKLYIVDFKTGEQSGEHHNQIEKYADVFSSLGYLDISKILVYINETVELVES